MADNVPITPGSGANVSTDDAGVGGHIQRMKLCYSADGDATHIGADANGLDVDVTRQPHVGDHDVAATLPTAQIGGRANSEKAPDTVPASVAAGDRVRAWHGLRGEYVTRERRVETFSAVYRLATVTARSSLVFAQVANTDKQWATLHHAATSTKLVRIHRAVFVLSGNTVAAYLNIALVRITSAPATGNPAITPKPHNQSNAATECVALALPGTAGTVDNAAIDYSTTDLTAGVTVGATTYGMNQGVLELMAQGDLGDSAQGIELRPGVLEGVAVVVRAGAATTVNGVVRIVYTEELAT